ncbi:TetR/AcrR family transcriptional regulator [Nocardia sp. NBC_01503]|uniref:TetR/AcrR family transcriptional regulator n=1 Tax=Nocardia sp. NBC_01503 TaxID=2975997 RepID=UPI002E7B5449|nr:TetR/AcrR family transcriptional regulator [Nocardia sp. NBC_01503]WTL35343.1 TetR/AcrR family transcriptional regulator [Nocardia sp. NBC_01503]
MAATDRETRDRRGDLLDRLADAIAENGIEGVSIRDLATRAGVSIGTVQYYFSTKSALLQAVWLHVREQAAQRFTSSGVVDMEPAEQLRKLTELLLAPSHEHRLSRVWLALAARAAHDPQIAALHREQWVGTEDLLDRVLARANPARATESADAAAALLALLDGLSISVLTEPDRMPPERAARIGAAWVDSWLG